MKNQTFFKRLLSLLLCFAALLSLSPSLSTPAQAYASPSKGTKSVSATKAYTINLTGAPYIAKITNFHIGHDYIYVSMRNGADANIYKLKISGSTAYYKTGSYTAERMIITGAGSCETLDMYNYNGKVYFLVGGNSSNTTYEWYPNTQVARVEFKAGTTKYSDHKRISYMNYAASYYDTTNKAAVSKKDGTTRRVAAAVCGEKTILRVEMVSDSDSVVVRFAVYDTLKLNQALDSSSLSEGLKLNSVAATQAKIQSHLMTSGSSGDLVHPNTSFKGIELSSYRSVYIAGGGSDAAHPQIARVDMEGGSDNWVYDYLITISNISNTEIYGLQADRGNIYFHTVGGDNEDEQAIWYFSESVVGYSCRKVGETEDRAHEIRYKEASQSPWGCTSAWTCTSAGFTPYVYCIYCGYQQSTQEYSSARGHDTVSLDAVAETCTTHGKTAGAYCRRCGIVQTAQTDIAPIGHDYGIGEVAQEATCTQKGIISYTCNNCGDTYTEETEKLLHTDSDINGICDVCGGSTDAEPQSILIDYAKTIESNIIEKAVINGISEEYLRNAEIVDVTAADEADAALISASTYDADGDGKSESIRFTPTAILSKVVLLHCTVRMSVGATTCERIIPVNVIPATSVYYETDFADGVFDMTTTGSAWEQIGEANTNLQDSGDCDDAVSEFVYGMQEIPSNAFFADFTGESERYARDYIYSGRNYDTASAWCYNADRTFEPAIDTALGTMTITRTANDPQKNDSFFYFQTGSTNNSIISGFDLNYQPEDNHYAVIRLKLSNLQLSDGATAPAIDIQYYTASDRTETANDNQDHIRSAIVNEYGEFEAYALPAQSLNGQYVTVKIPLTFDESYDRRKVTALRFSICNVLSISDTLLGGVTIDYIYVGPIEQYGADKTIKPEYSENPTYSATQYLFFDFDNSPNARARYNNSNYQSRTNFDTSAHWCYLANNKGEVENVTKTGTTATVDNDKGTLTVPVIQQQSSHGRYGTYVGPTNGSNQIVNLLDINGATGFSQSLNFTPSSSAKTYFHIRFKFRSCKKDQLLSIDEVAYLQLSLLNGTSTAQHIDSGMSFVFENDKYIELSVDVTDRAKACGTIKSFYIRFCNIVGNSTGYADIDYIYIGPESDPDKIRTAKESNVMIDFDNGDYDKNRYAGELYGGVNHDASDAWTNTYWYTHSIANGIMTLTPADDAINHESGWGWKTTNDDFSALNYQMTGEDYIVARIRVRDITGKNGYAPRVGFYLGQLEKGGTGQKHSGYRNLQLTENWATYVFDISSLADELNTVSFLYPNFNTITYGQNAAIEIDYIYLGSMKNGSAPAESLYFGFGNRLEDQTRYDSLTYSGVNYDDPDAVASNYYTSTEKDALDTSIAINNQEGTLELTATELSTDSAQPWAWFDIVNGKYETYPLNYHPQDAEIFQIRFKMENFISASDEAEPFFKVQYFNSRTDTILDLSSVTFSESYLSNGEYITLTIDLTDERGKAFCQQAEITKFRTFFGQLQSAPGKEGKISIDYIYVGPGKTSPAKDQLYGYDASYCNPSELSNGSSWFVEGAGVPGVSQIKNEDGSFTLDEIIYGESYTEASFSFVGTGFDLISRTNPVQGALRILVIGENDKVRTLSVVNKSNNENDLYQIPVARLTDLDYGRYTVKVFVNAAYDYGDDGNEDVFGGALDRGGQFYFDAVRIYGPINTAQSDAQSALAYSVYQSHGEADADYREIRSMILKAESFNGESDELEGVVYLDAKLTDGVTFEDAIAEYQAIGPNNEVYLSQGNAIAFRLEVTKNIPTSVDIGAKSVGSQAAEMVIGVSTTRPTAIPTSEQIRVDTATALYYGANVTEWQTDDTDSAVKYVYITIYNAGSGILSLTYVKLGYDVKTDAEKSAHFVVRPDMFATCSEHIYSYENCGENHTGKCKNCDYTQTEDHCFAEGVCICGALEKTEPKYDENLSMTMNVSVGAQMQVMYTVLSSKVKNYESFYVEVVKDVVGDESVKTVFSLTDGNMDEMFTPNGNLVGYSATYTGIFAMEMGDNFTATLYAVASDGTVYYSDCVSSSIRSYLMEKLADESTTPELKTLAVDMLSYGAAAQVNFNYDAQNLVNADLTNEQKALGTQQIPVASNQVAVSGSGSKITANVSLQSKVLLYINCSHTANESSELEFVVKNALTGETLERFAPSLVSENICQGVYGNVAAQQMRELITIELYDNGQIVSQTLTWNIESYVAQTRANSASSEALIATVNAMLAYGDSAAVYLTASGQ